KASPPHPGHGWKRRSRCLSRTAPASFLLSGRKLPDPIPQKAHPEQGASAHEGRLRSKRSFVSYRGNNSRSALPDPLSFLKALRISVFSVSLSGYPPEKPLPCSQDTAFL